MLISLLLISISILVLMKAANYLVDGASSLALRFHLNPLMIGLTVVAFGTSAPESVVSITSALSGNTAVAFGNIIGSNIANILLILGISAIITPLVVQKNTVWKEIPMSFLGAVTVTILGLQQILDMKNFRIDVSSLNSALPVGELSFSNGIVLLLFFIIFIYYTFGIAKTTGTDKPIIKKVSVTKSVLLIIAGLLGLALGSKLLVDNAIIIARLFGVSDQFIGLTVVAIGTSIPELITSIVAAMKKQVELAVGNVIGSNIFNIFFILGITSLITDIPITGQGVADILVLFLTTLLLFISLFVWKRHMIGKAEGMIMVASYITYIGYLMVR